MPRRYATEFTLQVGPIAIPGCLWNVPLNDRSYNEFKSIAPDVEEPTPVKQFYFTEDMAHGPYTQKDLDKAREIVDDDGEFKLVRVSAEDIEQMRASTLPLNIFRATVHPAEDVDSQTYETAGSYVFQPTITDEYYSIVQKLVRDGGKALIGVANIQNKEALFRLTYWRDQIVVQKLLWPDEVTDREGEELECDEADYEAALRMIERVERPFVVSEYRNAVRERSAALEGAITGREDITPAAPRRSLASMLDSYGE